YLYFLITKLFHILVQGEWTVTYSATQICALKGSTVEINCIYRYPFWVKDQDNEVEQTFWFAKLQNNEPVDLRTDSEYSGRVQYDCGQNDCTLRITDLRESDSAEYKFRFTTNQPGGKYTGSPGVTLSVTGSVSEVNLASLEVRVKRQSSCLVHKCSESELTCHSSCPLPRPLSYVWYRNGHITTQESQSFKGYFYSKDVISCAVKNHEDSLSPSVYAPTVVSLTVSLSGVIMEGRSITLTCSSDANPAAKYRWYKEDQILVLKGPHLEDQILFQGAEGVYHFSSIRSEDGGIYHCRSKNQFGQKTSPALLLDKVCHHDCVHQNIWSLRKKSFTQQHQPGERPEVRNNNIRPPNQRNRSNVFSVESSIIDLRPNQHLLLILSHKIKQNN
uniref:B-cell receptor CD22 n=1 Tax=Echeneis naucrates TaxID=173247 RepID=A0A665UDY5_ECHNA